MLVVLYLKCQLLQEMGDSACVRHLVPRPSIDKHYRDEGKGDQGGHLLPIRAHQQPRFSSAMKQRSSIATVHIPPIVLYCPNASCDATLSPLSSRVIRVSSMPCPTGRLGALCAARPGIGSVSGWFG